MEAKAKSIRFIETEGKIIIPFFQRTYVWDEENWRDLLDNIFLKPEGHFLGSIILKQNRVKSGEPKSLEVIDGQQRITTLSILIKVLYDLFSDEIRRNIDNIVRNILFYKKQATDNKYYIKIEHSYVDQTAYNKIIYAGFDGNPTIDISQISDNSHKIERCYKFFYEVLRDKNENDRKGIFNKLISDSNKMLVVIDIEEGKDDEQAIFDTLNTTGVRLTTAEIIKNTLFKRLIELTNREEAIELYKKHWEKTFLADEETTNYWAKERPTGRLTRDNLEILLHSFAIINGFFDPDKHTLGELSKLYKNEINNKKDERSLKNFIIDIVKYAAIYKDKFPDSINDLEFSFGEYEKRLFHILNVLEISTFHPLILYIYKKYEKNNEKIKEIFWDLERFIILRAIAQKNTQNYNKNCKEFIENPYLIKDKIETTREDIYSGLKDLKRRNKIATLLLFWVELYRRYNTNKYDTLSLPYMYTLEHIMPQKWEEYWRDVVIIDPNTGNELDYEGGKEIRNNMIYWIGNMTLLRARLNTTLRNHSFDKKLNGDGKNKGIKEYADLSITKEILKEKIWNEIKIKERTEKMCKEIEDIWYN